MDLIALDSCNVRIAVVMVQICVVGNECAHCINVPESLVNALCVDGRTLVVVCFHR